MIRLSMGLAGGALAAALFFGCSASAPSQDDIKGKFEEVVGASLECTVDSDCTIVFGGCPLPKYVSVSRAKAQTVDETARELLRRYGLKDQTCAYEDDGEPVPVPVCSKGACSDSDAKVSGDETGGDPDAG